VRAKTRWARVDHDHGDLRAFVMPRHEGAAMVSQAFGRSTRRWRACRAEMPCDAGLLGAVREVADGYAESGRDPGQR
jgi:hypothetical protein